MSAAVAELLQSLPDTFVPCRTIQDVASTYQQKVKRWASEGKIRVRTIDDGHSRYSLRDALRMVIENSSTTK